VDPNDQAPADEDLAIDPLAPVDEGEDHTNPTFGTGDLTDHERALLTDEELQGILEGEGKADDADAAVEADAAPAAAVEAETPAPAAPQPDQAPAAQPVATGLTDEAIDAAEAGLRAAKDGRKAVLDQYDDGELTAAERDAKMGELDDQIAQHAATLRLAEDAFNATKASFAQTAKGYLEANSILLDDAHLLNFDKMVREVSVSPLAIGKTHEQILAAAHRRYKADAAAFGIDIPDPVLGAAASKPQPQPIPTPPPLAPKPEAPMTLAKVPASGMTGPNEGPLGQLHAEWEKIGDDTAAQERFMARLARDPEAESAFLQAYG
jgi:hypothetical protein